MNKKLLAVAIGAALSASPMLVQAANLTVAGSSDEVKHPVGLQIGGMVQVEIANEEAEQTSAAGVITNVGDQTTVEDNSRGRFWIAADEDLGGGMRAMAHFEFRVDTTGVCESEGGGSTCNTGSNVREKWVGLKTNLGTVKLGSVRSPYKYAGGVNWDAFVTTNLEARGNGGMSGGVFGQNNFFDNSLNYTSPTFAGVSLGVTYSFDDVAATSTNGGGNGSTADDGDYSAAVEWKSNFGLHLIGAYSHNADNTSPAPGTGVEADQIKLGAKFTFAKNFSVIGQYETIEGAATTGGVANVDDKVLFLAFHANLGPVLAAIQYGKTEQGGAGTNSDFDYLALGAFYNFSKTFNVFTGYRITESEQTLPAGTLAATETKVFTLGMRKVF